MNTLFLKLLQPEPSAWRFLAAVVTFSCLISLSAIYLQQRFAPAQIIPDRTLGQESSA